MLGWVSMVPSVPRLRAAQSVREIGPTTWSFGAGRSPSHPQTLAEEGRLKEATTWPLPLVKVMVLPEVRP